MRYENIIKKGVVFAVVLVLSMGMILAGCGKKEGGSSEVKLPERPAKLAEFSAVTLEGESFTQEDLKDYDLTVINLWATWCGPCLKEMPDLAAFEKALPENVHMLTYCVDYEDTAEISKVLNKAGYEGTVLIEAAGDMKTLNESCMYIPVSVFLDSEGNFVHEDIEGSRNKFEDAYLEAVNESLKSLGKDEIALD